MPFLLDGNPTSGEISEAVNYLLANFDSSVSADPNTGVITGPTGEISGYLYKYMAVKYADSFDGTVNFSNVPANRLYYGIRNNNDASESSNPADYIWFQATGGFGLTKSLWYISTGGRQIQFAVSVAAPDAGWLVDPGASIDLDVVTSGNIPVIAETFTAYFTPAILQVPRSGNPLTPTFTGVTPTLYATDGGTVVPFSDAQSDSSLGFTNGTWRIGNSSTTGNVDISYTNVTVGSPTDGGDYAVWPAPTAMAGNPAYISAPIRYKNSLGVVTQAGVATVQLLFTDPGAVGPYGSSIDVSGYTGFVQNTGGLYTPSTATLTASIVNITSPSYSWSISGATPTSSTSSSVVVTPTSGSTGVTVTLTVNGSNLLSPISKTVLLPVIYDGAQGTAGANGVMSAFPTIYIWTGSSVPPTRPSTTSTYTWATGGYSAPSGWSTDAPSNTIAGNYLWAITIPLTVVATTVTSTLDWTNTAYGIRCIAYNGANGTSGTNGTAGSATFVVTRTANDSSAPTNAETTAVIGRNPVAGDIVTVSYNSANNAVVYRYTTSWVTQATYLTGSLIVDGTITGSKVSAGTITGTNIAATTITAANIAGGTITADKIATATITAASGVIANAAITYANINTATITSLSALNTITGTLTVDSAGYIQGGQTGYNTGTGFFLGYSGGAYKFSIGNPSGKKLTWNGSALYVSGAANTVVTSSSTERTSSLYLSTVGQNPTSWTYTNVHSVAITTSGGPINITAVIRPLYLSFTGGFSNNVAYAIRVRRDSTVINYSTKLITVTSGGTTTYYYAGLAYSQNLPPGTFIVTDTPAAGTYTYYFDYVAVSIGGNTAATAYYDSTLLSVNETVP